jgi:hypothetical protein
VEAALTKAKGSHSGKLNADFADIADQHGFFIYFATIGCGGTKALI